MSKKSRSRNKKILAVLGIAGAGIAASRRKGTDSTNPVGGVDQIAKDAAKKNTSPKVDVTPKAKPDTQSPTPKSRHTSPAGKSPGQLYQARRKDAPATGTTYPGASSNKRVHVGRGGYSSGGSVKSVGAAKRGFGKVIK